MVTGAGLRVNLARVQHYILHCKLNLIMNYSFDFRKYFSPLFLLVLAIETICFIIDLNFQRDYPKGLLYFFPLLLIWNTTPMQIFSAISIVSILEVIGYFYSPQGLMPYHLSVMNRFSSLLIFWLVTIVFIARIRAHKAQLKSEKQYRQLIETANSVVLRCDPTGTILFVNRYGVQFFGYTEEEMLGRNVISLVPGMEQVDLSKLSVEIEKYPDRYITFTGDSTCKDGTTVWVSWANKAITDEHGKVIELLAIGNDITYQKQVENELRQSKAKLEAVLENINDGLVIRQPDGEFFLINRACMDMFGYTTEDEAKKEFLHIQENWELFDDQGNLLPFEQWPFMRGCREAYHNVIIRAKRKDNAIDRYSSHSGTPVYDSNGNLIAVVATFQDITERRNAEEELRQRVLEAEEGKRMLDAIMEYAPEGITISDARESKILLLSRHGQDILDISYEGKTAFDLAQERKVFYPDATTLIPDHELPLIKAMREEKTILNYEVVQFNRKNEKLHLLCNAAPIRNAKGETYAGIITWRDITGQKKIEQALKESEEKASAVLKSLAEGVLLLDTKGNIVKANPAMKRLFNRDFEELAHPENYLEQQIIRPDGTPKPRDEQPANVALRTGKPVFDVEEGVLCKDGSVLWVSINVQPLRNEQGVIIGAVASYFDITRRKNAEEAQKKSEEWLKILNEDLENMVLQRTGQVRSLATALTLAEQRERKRISYILHEELQQLLICMRMLIGQYLRERSAELTNAGEFNDISELQVILDKALETIRILSIELNPPVLRSQGLDAALDWLVHHMKNNYDLAIDLCMCGALSSIRNETQLMLIQMIRELLVNVIQHAEIRTARVKAFHKNKTIRISVYDEGKGFDTAAVFEKRDDESGLSLLSIRERLRLFNGKLSITSTPGEGTTCVITMPLGVC